MAYPAEGGMKKRFVVSLVLGLAMVSSSALTGVLTPHQKLAEEHERFSLETMIPPRFGDWQVDPTIVPLTPDPERQGVLEKIYDQTLSRTYINRSGERVMLSIAYGGDQSRALQLHLPEVCYVAQGFDMLRSESGSLATRYGEVPVKRLVARQNSRNEPITYWITIGDKAIKPGIEQKLQRFAYGLSGKIPDGMLVRVSTIQSGAAEAYRLQDRFVTDMLGALDGKDRVRLLGTPGQRG
jgi:EpsI family protein